MENRIDDDKLKHIRAVAEVMYDNADALTELHIDKEVAYTVGLLHDIGYIRGKENHSKNGADIVDKLGMNYMVGQDNVNAINYHGTDGYTMIVNGNLKHISPMLLLLQYADLSVDKEGNKVGFEKRLADIQKRYDKDRYNKVCKITDFLKEVFTFEIGKDTYPTLKPLTEKDFYERIGSILDRYMKTNEKETEYDRE